MTKILLLAFAAAGLVGASLVAPAMAFEHGSNGGNRPDPGNRWVPWHTEWYDPAWGQPVALVVPPTAGTHTEYSWGVGGTRTVPILNQFQRGYPGDGAAIGGALYPTPYWPSDTNQFGVYYIRGPW